MHRHSNIALMSSCVLALAVAACDGERSDTAFTEGATRAADLIDAATIHDTVAELADDRYEGRAPGSAGDEAARAYLAKALDTLGFAPGASGGWQQYFDLIGLNAAQPDHWRFTGPGGETLDLARPAQFVVASGKQAEMTELDDAELVFVGYGIEAPEYDWDDYKGADLAGKVLVMLNNDPDWDPELFAGKERLYYGRWSYKYESAARQGAAGAIIIHTTPSAGYPWQVVQSSWTGTQFELPAGDEPRLEVYGWVSEDAAVAIARLAGHDLADLVAAAQRRDFRPVPLGVHTSIVLPTALTRTSTANVLGVLRGSDPNLADEVVVYSAHHDHLGVGEPNPNGDPDDRIYNGARDNASGVGMVLAIARAYAALAERPRRSILIAFVGAEEQGLLGSAYYAAHPTFPAGKIAADINYDSGNIWGRTHDVSFVGYGKSSLDQVADAVAAHQGRVVVGDQFPDRGYFYRADQFSFARIGVPGIYLHNPTDFVGRPKGWGEQQVEHYTEVNYHQPSDELTDDWNFDGMVDDARFGFWAGLMVANADDLPAWEPGDEFEAARQSAVAASQ